MAKPRAQLKGKRRRNLKKLYTTVFGDTLTPQQEKLMLKEDASMGPREPLKPRHVGWADISSGRSNT